MAGAVSGVGNAANYRVVGYSRGEEDHTWWVQPTAKFPLTKIGDGGRWVCRDDGHGPSGLRGRMFGGVEYAALLVTSDYEPPAQMTELPERDGVKVLDVKAVAGRE